MMPKSLMLAALFLPVCAIADERSDQTLRYVPAPIDNPLKGLVPYSGDRRDLFPHSLEFNYLPLSDLMTGYDAYNWQPLESLLDDIASRQHQTVFRIWLEYPGHKEGIPKFLEADGVKVTEWLYTETQPFPPKQIRTPDYADPKLRRALSNFIAALGKKYDGDPRIGYITAGLLGTWGEWHNYPRTELMASKAVQLEVMDAYENAFSKTRVLLRYPAGADNFHYADNSNRRLGYHDDSFAWATLDTGRPEDSWHFMAAMKAAGPQTMNRWKSQPIGGEIRPEVWGTLFDNSDKPKTRAQPFGECVQTTHATWLMDSGMFEKKQSKQRIANATAAVQKMGYEFHIQRVSLERASAKVRLRIEVRNTGVAPFYADWPIEVATGKSDKAFDNDANLQIHSTAWLLSELLPGDVRKWSVELPSNQNNTPVVGLRVVNPLSNGLPLRFANDSKRQMSNGWLKISKPSDK